MGSYEFCVSPSRYSFSISDTAGNGIDKGEVSLHIPSSLIHGIDEMQIDLSNDFGEVSFVTIDAGVSCLENEIELKLDIHSADNDIGFSMVLIDLETNKRAEINFGEK